VLVSAPTLVGWVGLKVGEADDDDDDDDDEYPGYGQLLVIHGYPWIVSVFFWLFRCEMTVVFTVVCSCLHEWTLEDYLQLQRCDFFIA